MGCGSYFQVAAAIYRLRRLLSCCCQLLSDCCHCLWVAAVTFRLRQLFIACGSYFQVAAVTFLLLPVTFRLLPLKRTGSFFVCRGSQFFFVAAIEISGIHPQKGLFLRTDLGFSVIHPQKGLLLRTDFGFSVICSFLILVDYLDVLSLRRVDSVYKL